MMYLPFGRPLDLYLACSQGHQRQWDLGWERSSPNIGIDHAMPSNWSQQWWQWQIFTKLKSHEWKCGLTILESMLTPTGAGVHRNHPHNWAACSIGASKSNASNQNLDHMPELSRMIYCSWCAVFEYDPGKVIFRPSGFFHCLDWTSIMNSIRTDKLRAYLYSVRSFLKPCNQGGRAWHQ